ncbi:endonuclease MutS2 [Brochothrix campestris]|uniref:Endonuclease MutS2 n=1 Tax=Brochothrix campestris FSL F6-1037 TaxID=1265861 RepID=W7CIL6_9LIST|nr:endonuclease MutS2 [Brochothrix campestris]EUJ39229.1 recombination and DNA strand exchange inhibitor protein [Brochothrix campestris FSL F6-1037]
MNKKVAAVLEFEKIKQRLIEQVVSSLGEKHIHGLKPATDLTAVQERLAQTDEAAKVLRLRGEAPLQGIHDVTFALKRLEIGADLNGTELYQVARNLQVARLFKAFIMQFETNGIEMPALTKLAESLVPLLDIEKEVLESIDETGYVMDAASTELRAIRSALVRSEGYVREKLEGIIRSRSASKMLSDAIITIRNDRYVIPVKIEYKGQFGGIVHDQSASGQTLFIEPQAVVDLNNERRELQVKERHEVARILKELSVAIEPFTNEISHNTHQLGVFDFTFAKARLGKQMNAVTPLMNDQRRVNLIDARHPLINPADIVPNDIYVGGDFEALIITGPNTGGKTITLKTLGLLAMMAQSGLQIPAEVGSELPIYSQIFADIGDEQSIEQSLSTFSSHMTNIVHIFKEVDENSLVLFDELGAGTDPQEGAALAIAILDAMHQTGAQIMATTHYPELKAFAYNRSYTMNASVEFDVETLKPTYRLQIGIPGRSNAFDISQRLGLPADVIDSARGLVDEESTDLNNMISELEDMRQQAEVRFEEAVETVHEASALHKQLEEALVSYETNKNRLLDHANSKANAVIMNAEETADKIIKELREMQSMQRSQFKEHELIERRHQLSEARPKTLKKGPIVKPKVTNHVLAVGDTVRVESLGQKGELIKRVDKKSWQVQMGHMKTTIKETNMTYVTTEKPQEQRFLTTIKRESHVKTELDLRGARYEDAVHRLDKYLDEALLAGYAQVSIIHGKGTGALRQGVQDYLKQHRLVKGYHHGAAAEGGNGMTVVELK